MHARLCLLVVASLSLAGAAKAQALTTRASVDSAGVEGSGVSWEPDLSADGRYVVFSSQAQLAPGDTNGSYDVYRRDRQSGVTELVSWNLFGTAAGGGNSTRPAVSGDGRYVVFESSASNLVPGDTNGWRDVFLRDLELGTTELVSTSFAGGPADWHSNAPDISDDGQWVVFDSQASNLLPIPVGGPHRDIYLWTQGAVVALLSLGGGGGGNDDSLLPKVSADGSIVVFHSRASDLVNSDTNSASDVFRHEVATAKTLRVSVTSSGVQGNGDSQFADVSGDGLRIVYESLATNLVPGDTNGLRDVFGYFVPLKSTARVSVGPGGVQGNGASSGPRISTDGSRAAFVSQASNFAPGDTNNLVDTFLVDLGSAFIKLVSVDAGGTPSTGTTTVGIDGTGTQVAYGTPTGWPGDTNGDIDVYVSDPLLEGRAYCTAGTSASGCQASLSAAGVPSLSLSTGYVVSASGVEGAKDGIFFFGTNGRQAATWSNGTSLQCVVPPVRRTGVQSGSGTLGACNGSAGIDLNAWFAANPAGAPPSGILTQLQYWYRDPLNTSKATTSFSNALEFVVAP